VTQVGAVRVELNHRVAQLAWRVGRLIEADEITEVLAGGDDVLRASARSGRAGAIDADTGSAGRTTISS
jgi:hypothetical protein